MRIPGDIEDLVMAFIEPEQKKELRWMTRADIDAFIISHISTILELGYVEKNGDQSVIPYIVTPRGKEILQILSPCKRSGR
jgi:predicted transcriptional regulator